MTEQEHQSIQENSLKNIDTEDFALPFEGEGLAVPLVATVGEELPEGTPLATRDELILALKAVQDPELMLDIYELGLIYNIDQDPKGNVKIVMTLTSPTCPIAGDMPSMVAHAVSSVPGTGKVTVELVFDPPWTIDRLSEEIRLMMGL